MTAARALPFLFLLASFALPAQEVGHSAGPAVARPPAVIVTTSFRGGTMAEFVAVLRATEPKANIVVATAAAGAKIPAMDLRSAGLEQALEGACAVAEAESRVRVVEFKGSGEPVYSIIAMEPASVVGPGQLNQTTPVQKPDEGTQVFSLNRLTDIDPRLVATEGFRVETILSAIEASAADDPKKAALQLRFHRDSGLLFVRGTRAQISIAKDLLSNLERDLDERRRRSTPTKAPGTPDPAVNKDKDADKKD